jgi:hypothetical protein
MPIEDHLKGSWLPVGDEPHQVLVSERAQIGSKRAKHK